MSYFSPIPFSALALIPTLAADYQNHNLTNPCEAQKLKMK